MTYKFKHFIAILFMAAISSLANAQTKIAFEVSFTEPQAHYVDVEMEVSGLKKDQVDIKMPVWAPGSYLIREFAKNVESFTAKNAKGESLPLEKINKNTWRVNTQKNGKVKINYRVYAFEISVRTSFVDASHAFLSPTGIFMYVDGMINNPATVTINPHKSWSKISTGLETVKSKSNTFYAENFDILFDSPIEVGNQDVFEFNASGVRHEVAMVGGGNYDKSRLKKDMAKIVEEETAIFGVNPNKHYVFIVHHYSSGGGGLEHLNSTVLGASRLGYTNENTYKNFLGLVAHEYFHLWNVKRLRPVALGPFDYDSENYTSNLWIAEGFTAYYDNLVVRRADFHTAGKYLNALEGDINLVENQPGTRIQSLSESSFDAWIKGYRPNENSRNTTISYYNKGALVAMVLDLAILNSTKGSKRLDDVMKAMYEEYFVKKGRGYTDAEFKAMAEKIGGISLNSIYDKYVNGTVPIDYQTYLSYAGLKIVDEGNAATDPFLGASATLKDGKLIVNNVVRGSAAWDSGLNVNDEVIAIDGYRVNELDKTVASKKVGDNTKIQVSRDGALLELQARITRNPAKKYRIMQAENASAEQISIRNKWLNLKDENVMGSK
ncbi:M61 family metallopeptidase [Daejeonella oryzae]|uniref:M61 family metallopeptidase n=1 Tax=Daejeonella oryzae TaxID=1122943 RepID=UPI0004105EDD|nr:PDZ domain-containing protein [Daejeonella oryzae]